ncbi:general transcription factor II-I repeat domain-containing protein 2-like [Oratosquilla oratoria]|uniref:general transcription factor II-I repeat domain-containing protein 2-like n=1 Tax=Oratosquilla oratoria TaxID=337810 RepID=UPI003F7617AA
MKPFADGDFIKECLLAVVDSVCPEQRSAFESVSLSSCIVRCLIEDMSDNVHDSFKTRSSNFVAFSLALDESTDTKDMAQLAVFICSVTADLQVCEEFLQLVPLRGTTTGQDICNAVLQCVDQHSLDLSCFMCVTTDGAPTMVGEKKGAASLLVRHCEAAGYAQPINMMHCTIHQESLTHYPYHESIPENCCIRERNESASDRGENLLRWSYYPGVSVEREKVRGIRTRE